MSAIILKKCDFSNQEIYVGLDVHYKTWHATIMVGEVAVKYQCPADSKILAAHLKKEYPNANFKAAYEAGCFGFYIKEQLDTLGISTGVINPADIPTSNKDKVGKTDARDSRKIAMSLKNDMVEPIYAPDKEDQQARSLLRRRDDLTGKTTRVKNQIKSLLKFYGVDIPADINTDKWSKRFIEWLGTVRFETSEGTFNLSSLLRELEFFEHEKKSVLNELKETMKKEKYNESYEIIKSIPGFGAIGAMSIVLEVFDINRFATQDQFSSYIGLAPMEHSSGERTIKGGLSWRFNRVLRCTFIEAAWVAIRTDPAMTQYYNHCTKKMKSSKAIIKVARKLANRLRYLWKKKMKYVKSVVA